MLQLGSGRPPCRKAKQMQRFTRPRARTEEQGQGLDLQGQGQGLVLQGQGQGKGLENCP